jgi:hypothetical protein
MTDRPQSGDASHFAEMLLRKTMGEGRLIKVPLETDTTPPAGDDAAAIREAAERLTCAEDIYSEYLKNSDLTDDLEDQMYDDIRLVARAALDGAAREAALVEELAQTRAHEHVLVIVGDMLARRLEWLISEPTPMLVPEVLDAIKERATQDTEQWLTAIHNAGFNRPDEARAALAPGRAGAD